VLIAAAVFAAILYVVGVLAPGTLPSVTDSPAEVVAWLHDHKSGVRVYAWTATFGALALSVALGIIRGLLPRPHGDIFLLGAAAFIVETAIQAWFWGALALHPETISPDTARTALDITSFWGPILTGTTMTMIGAVTALAWSKPPQIPRWLTVIGVIVFVEQAIETITVFGTHGFISPGGDMNLGLGGPLTLIWLAALVVWAVRSPA
jgi:hypothetical protein